MKILSKTYNILTSYDVNKKQDCKNYSQPVSFSCGKDVFIKRSVIEPLSQGLKEIRKVHAGEYGSVCEGSIPLSNFFDLIPACEHSELIKRGLSTNKNGAPHCFLKSSADNPLSTSSVFDCSVMYLFNEKTNTHFLYHASPYEKKDTLDFIVKQFMPEGVTHACLSPGRKEHAYIHGQILPQMFSVIKKNNNKNVVINVLHQSSTYPEIVGYKGMLFEIPNKTVDMTNNATYGQATFKISDLRDENTFIKLRQDCISSTHVDYQKDDLISKDWDVEIQKVMTQMIDKRAKIISEIEKCQTKEDLQKVVLRNDTRTMREYLSVIAMQYYKIIGIKNY